MAHLGERITALVDGQLTPDAAERAHIHLASCRQCRDAVERERVMKSRMAGLQGPPPAPDLVQRLLALGGPHGPLPPRVGHLAGGPRPATAAFPGEPEPATGPAASSLIDLAPAQLRAGAPSGDPLRVPVGAGAAWAAGPPDASDASSGSGGRSAARGVRRSTPLSRGPRRSGPGGLGPGGFGAVGVVGAPGSAAVLTGPGRAVRRRRLAVAVLGALSVVGVGVSGLVADAGDAGPPALVPPVDTFVVDHAVTTRNLPFADVPVGWLQGGEATRAPGGNGFFGTPGSSGATASVPVTSPGTASISVRGSSAVGGGQGGGAGR